MKHVSLDWRFVGELSRKLLCAGVLAAPVIMVGGCESDLPPPHRPGERPESDLSMVSDPSHEYLAAQPDAVPLLEVGLPNKKGDKAQVKTVFDALKPPVTQPAAQPTVTPHPVFTRGSFDTSVTAVTPTTTTSAPATQP